jgi:hypothetical protein
MRLIHGLPNFVNCAIEGGMVPVNLFKLSSRKATSTKDCKSEDEDLS